MIKINYDFIPQGSIVDINEDTLEYRAGVTFKKWNKQETLICDTGGNLGEGIIDHHFAGSGDKCCAALIYYDISGSKKLFKHLNSNNAEFNIITHVHPDFDAITSCYLIERYLQDGSLPEYAEDFVQYVDEVDSGKLVIDSTQPINPATMVLAISSELSKQPSDLTSKNISILKETYKLFDKIFELLQEAVKSIWSAEFLSGDLSYLNKYKEIIMRDKDAYLNIDIPKSLVYTIDLLNTKENTYDKVDLLVTDSRQSELWKYWARGDLINSPQGKGFNFTCAFYNTFKKTGKHRAIIATDPNTPYTLKGLGILLEKYEMEELEKNGLLEEELFKEKREGFHRHDPWYDGRTEFHNYTIIDSPSCGSFLNNELILEIILKNELWLELGDNFNKYETVNAIRGIELKELSDYDHRLDPILEDLENLSHNRMPHIIDEINDIAYGLKCISLRNTIQGDKRELTRKKIYNVFVRINNKTKDKILNYQLTKIISDNFPTVYLKNWLINTKELGESSLMISLGKLFNRTLKEEIIPLTFIIQTNHYYEFKRIIDSNKFSNLIFDLISLQQSEKNKLLFSSLNNIANKVNWNIAHSAIKEKIPLSSFLFYSNLVDEVQAYTRLKNSKAPANNFINSINEFLNSISSNVSNESLGSVQKNYLELKDCIKKELFGGDNQIIKRLRDNFIRKHQGLIPELKTFLLQDYDNIDVKSFFILYERLRNLSSSNNSQDDFLIRLKVIFILRIYEDLFARSGIILRLSELNKIEELYLFNPELSILLKLLENLLKNILTNHNISENAFQKNLLESLEKINQLKNINYPSLGINLEYIIDDLHEFIKSVHEEISQENLNVEGEIENSFLQYDRVFVENGLIRKIERLPIFFRDIFEEIFFYYKNYYEQKIHLFETTKKAVECDDEKFKELINVLLEKIVYFDIINVKRNINNEQQRKSLYLHLFYREWLKGNDENSYGALNTAIMQLAKNNQSLNKYEELIELNSGKKIYDKQFLDSAVNKISIYDGTIHLTKQLYLRAYNYIIEKRLDSYDFENARYSLEKISPKFPIWLRILSNRRTIKFITLGIILLILLASAFDNNIYEFNGVSFRPSIPLSILNLMPNYFNTISTFFQVLWICVIYGTIISAFIIIALKVFKKSSTKLNDNIGETLNRIYELTENKKLSLLLLHFLFPLLIVIAEVVHPETLGVFFNIGGSRLIYLGVLSIILVIYSIRKDIQNKNPYRSIKWVKQKASYVFWLYLFQTLVVIIFTLDLFVRFEVTEEMFSSYKNLMDLGFSKIIEFHFHSFSIFLFPVFTFTMTVTSLLFSVFIDKIFSKKEFK